MTSRTALLLGPMLVGLAMSGCAVGQGSGEANGQLYVLNCSKSGDYCDGSGVCGTSAAAAPYKLNPGFFSGEPINDLTQNLSGSSLPRANRVTIRLQRSGKQIESNDALFFEIVNSYEVARCVRGREIVLADKTIQHDYDDRFCSRASAMGPARMRITVLGGYIHSTLSPLMTCTRHVAATADDTFPQDGVIAIESSELWKSWIEFQDFGAAAQNDRPDPTTRDPISPTFKIELEQRLRASAFSLTLKDQKVVMAQVEMRPLPPPDIGGSLAGWFDFDLTRGQGAQIFP